MLKRDGVVRVFAVPNRQKATLLPLIVQHTSPGSLFYTDEYSAYASLKVQGEHIVVTKDKGIPVGREHINGIEGFWSYAELRQELAVHVSWRASKVCASLSRRTFVSLQPP